MKHLLLGMAGAAGAFFLFAGSAMAIPPCSDTYPQCNQPAYGGPNNLVCVACKRCAKMKGKFIYMSNMPKGKNTLCQIKVPPTTKPKKPLPGPDTPPKPKLPGNN